MSELNPSYVISQMPNAIERLQEWHLKKLLDSCDVVMELSKQTGAPQAIKDAEAYRRIMEVNADYMKRFCGEEGDTGTETGSLWGAVTIAKKMQIAVGGAN